MLDFYIEMDHDHCSQLTLVIYKLDQDMNLQIYVNIQYKINSLYDVCIVKNNNNKIREKIIYVSTYK